MHEHVPDFVMPITDRLVDTFLQAEPLKPKVILFHASETPPREFVALAANFVEDFLFALIPESDKASAEKFGVTSYPTIRLLFIPRSSPGRTLPAGGSPVQTAEFPSRGLAYVEMHGWLQQVQMQVLGKDLGQGDAARRNPSRSPCARCAPRGVRRRVRIVGAVRRRVHRRRRRRRGRREHARRRTSRDSRGGRGNVRQTVQFRVRGPCRATILRGGVRSDGVGRARGDGGVHSEKQVRDVLARV